MKKLLVLIFLSLLSIASSQEKIEEIELHEIRTYTPQKNGVVDLIFEARIEHLTEMLSANLLLGKLVDVSFKIYWASPSQYKIEIYGLPKGFEEIKADLITLIKGKLDFVLPDKLADKFKGYILKTESLTDGKLIHAIDATYTMTTPEIDIVIDKQGQLKTSETKSAGSAIKIEFAHSPKSWSNNKLVLDKMTSKSSQGGILLTSVNELEYGNVGGIGFPVKITVKNTSEITMPKTKKEKEKKIKGSTGTVIHFSKFEVNTGKAKRYINDGLLK